jgi:hypothetical protein
VWRKSAWDPTFFDGRREFTVVEGLNLHCCGLAFFGRFEGQALRRTAYEQKRWEQGFKYAIHLFNLRGHLILASFIVNNSNGKIIFPSVLDAFIKLGGKRKKTFTNPNTGNRVSLYSFIPHQSFLKE